ncbi:hypothetical protein GF324_08450 [bacterium]|nr:hypothetical protein [bacterium]
MKKTVLTLLLLSLLPVGTLRAGGSDIRLMEGLDPRIEVRIAVLPASLPRSVKRVNPRTVSALMSTELLRIYDVMELMRFEQILQDRRFEIGEAFGTKAQPVVQNSAGVDALASLEVYRWDTGSPGFLMMASKGYLGVRLRLIEPGNGQVYWSVNRLARTKPGLEFLDAATIEFANLVHDLDKALRDREYELTRMEAYAERKEEVLQKQIIKRRSVFEERLAERIEDSLRVVLRDEMLEQPPDEWEQQQEADLRAEQPDADEAVTEETPEGEQEEMPVFFLEEDEAGDEGEELQGPPSDTGYDEELEEGAAPEAGEGAGGEGGEEDIPTLDEGQDEPPVDLPDLFGGEQDTTGADTSGTIELPDLDFDNLDELFEEGEEEEFEEEDEGSGGGSGGN